MKKLFSIFFLSVLAFLAFLGIGLSGGGFMNVYAEGEEPQGVVFHYTRADEDYSTYNALWVWPKGGDGHEYALSETDSYGRFVKIDMNLKGVASVGFIVKKQGTWDYKDAGGSDRYADFAVLNLDAEGYYHVYLVGGDVNIYTSGDGAISDGISNFSVDFVDGVYYLSFLLTTKCTTWKITKNGTLVVDSTTALTDENLVSSSDDILKKATYKLGTDMPSFEDLLTLTADFPDEKTLTQNANMASLYNTDAFVENYTYDGKLGAIYSATSTTFRVWTPLSTAMKVRVYDNGTPVDVDAEKGNDAYTEYDMNRGEKGTWEATVPGDLDGKYYTYVVTNYKYTDREIVDPYAKSTGVNGRRGMVVNFDKVNQELGWDSFNINEINPTNLTVYETHIADLTSSSTWGGDAALAKTYKGFYQEGTTYTADGKTVKTGFDHIKELGVNAVQIIPIFDSDNDEVNRTFNWGYNPLNYNALDGSYSTNPYDGYEKIREFKTLVKKYTSAGINIIMDVVYNHMMYAEGSNFDVLMPYYYFRYTSSGMPSNGSGCGNETASNMPMFRKFMIDSTEFWAKEYKLGGFRFDLMGLHDIETMNKLSENLHDNVSEYVVVYGEPWAGGTPAYDQSLLAYQSNILKYTEYGCFNDKIRDALIKGGLSSDSAKGWVTGGISYSQCTVIKDQNTFEKAVDRLEIYIKKNGEYIRVHKEDGYIAGKIYFQKQSSTLNANELKELASGIAGFIKESPECNKPWQTLTYVTCHDNYTLVDRIAAAGITDKELSKKMAMLANSVVFTSQGISFMLAGEEFLRTKGGDKNSYSSSYKVNELDYALKVTNYDMFENYQKLIALKQKEGLFGQTTVEACKDIKDKLFISEDTSMISYKIRCTENGKLMEYYVIHVNGLGEDKDHVADLSGYSLYLDTLNTGVELSDSYQLQHYQTIVAYREADLSEADISTEQAKAGAVVTDTFNKAKEKNSSATFFVGQTKIEFNNAAVGEIAGKDVKLYVNKNTPNVDGAAYVLDLELEGATFASGEAKVSFRYDVPEGQSVKVYYINENGAKVDVNATYENGKITFTTTHFSTYAVFLEAAPQGGLPAGAIVAIIIGSITLLAVAGFCVYYFLLRKRSA